MQVLRRSYEQQSLPGTADLARGTVMTSLTVLCMPAVLAVLANRKGRKLTLDAIETVLASILVVLLLSIVLGLPVGRCCCAPCHYRRSSAVHASHPCMWRSVHADLAGAVYLTYKAMTFMLRSLWHSAIVTSTLAALKNKLGL